MADKGIRLLSCMHAMIAVMQCQLMMGIGLLSCMHACDGCSHAVSGDDDRKKGRGGG